MPLTILVRNPGGSEPSPLTFDGDRVVLGRGAFVDVRLPDPSVSSRHASVRVIAGEYLLFDEGSTNGTVVGGVRLLPETPRTLRSGDLVRLGRVWVEVRTGPAPLTQDLPLATRELAFHLVAQAMRAVGDDTVPCVNVVEGPDRGAILRLENDGEVYVIGRAETCALPLSDPDASREHVHVVRRGGTVQDLGGKNQAALGETWVSSERAVVWRRPAMLRVGRSVLSLVDPVAAALAELEASVDEPLPPDGAPPAPPPSSHSHGGPPSLGATPAPPAPLAADPSAIAPRAPRKSTGWTATDVIVGGAALLIILLSGAGLYWLLKP